MSTLVRLTYQFNIDSEEYGLDNPTDDEYVAMAESSFGLGELVDWEIKDGT